MKDRKPRINKKVLEAVLDVSRRANRLFKGFNAADLTELSNYHLALCIYGTGFGLGNLDALRDFAKNIPDYQEAVTRFETTRDKLYKEAQRRDLL